MTYGKRLDEALKHAAKSRKALADVLGCTPQAIGIVINWSGEKDRKLETEAHAEAARFLKVSDYWLATGKEDMILTRNQAQAHADTAQAATKMIATDVQMLIKVLDALPLDQRANAANAALSALVHYLPLAVPGTQEQANGVTQASIHG
jgi:hypothetical protein